MKIVNIIGGLGNQMFQYAFALSLKNKYPDEQVLIDISHFHYIIVNKIKSANLHNGYEIEKVFPNANLEKANALQLIKVTWYVPNYFLSRVARRVLPQRKTETIQSTQDYFAHKKEYYGIQGDCYFEGIWESIHNYLPIREILLKTFEHRQPDEKNRSYIHDMEEKESVGIHIRRGDYLYAPEFKDICGLEYYKKAIAEILKDKKQHIFYVFSNDQQWCKKNIIPLLNGHEFVMVTHNKGEQSCWDMHLMTHCKNLIIANSSFSWWGAFLNERHGRIVAPKKWVNRDAEYDIWDSSWILL